MSGWPPWGEALALYAGCLLAWGLGLYVVTRGGLRRIPLLAMGATVTLVVYLLGQALGSLGADLDAWLSWGRRTWWGAALAPSLWLLLTLALAADEAPDEMRGRATGVALVLGPLAVGAGAVFAALGGATSDLVVRWDEATSPQGPPHVPPGPLFGAYQLYVVASLLGAAVVLASLWIASERGSPVRPRLGWLLLAAMLFLLSGAYITGASGLFGFTAVPGQLLLVLGLLVMGWSLLRYGALLAGEVVWADLVGFALALAAIVGGYALLLVAFVPLDYIWLERALPALLLLMLTHALADRRSEVVDRVLYGGVAAVLQARLRELAQRVVRQPDAATALADVRESVAGLVREQTATLADRPAAPAEFRVLVEGALRRLNDLPALSEHPLLDRVRGPDGGSALERAALLRGELEGAIGRLRPASPKPAPRDPAGPGGWLHHLVLHEAYLEGRPNKQVMQRYHLSEGTFHRARRRAIDSVAEDLHARLGRRGDATP